MGQLQKIEDELKAIGFEILAVSPDEPERMRETAASNRAGYRLLSDPDLRAAEAFGVAYHVDDATLERYRKAGIGLRAGKLPVPSVFIVRPGGEITFSYANPDIKVRLDPAVLLAAARAAGESP